MISVARTRFLERRLIADDLRAMTDMWLGWRRLAAIVAKQPVKVSYRLELLLEGVPRPQQQQVRAALATTAARLDLPTEWLGARDLDTLRLGTPLRPLEHAHEAAAIGRLLMATPAMPIVWTYRVSTRATASASTNARPPTSSESLVLCGLVAGGETTLKCLWVDDAGEGNSEVARADEVREAAVHAALDSFLQVERQVSWGEAYELDADGTRRLSCQSPADADSIARCIVALAPDTDQVVVAAGSLTTNVSPSIVAQAATYCHRDPSLEGLFSASGQRTMDRYLRWFHTPLGEWRPFVKQLGRFGVPLLLAIAGLRWLALPRPVWWCLLLVALGCALGLGWIILQRARLVVQLRTSMVASLRRVYSVAKPFAAIDLEAAGLADDPVLRKLSAEIEQLGACRFLELELDGVARRGRPPVARLFVLESDCVYLTVGLIQSSASYLQFPPLTNLRAETIFRDGTGLVTLGSPGWHRKPLAPDRAVVRCVPGCEDPAVLLARHRTVLRRLVREGREPVLLTRDQSLARMAREHDEMRQRNEAYGYYSYGDALHDAFGLIRREYLEPADRAG